MKKRHYDDGCAAMHAMDIIGERWALAIVRELILGPKRFTDLKTSLPGISPNVLTQRLEEMEETSILVRRKTPPPNALSVYELTPWAMELEDILKTLGRWAARSPTKPDGPMSVNSLILSFRTMFSAESAADFRATLQFTLSGQSFVGEVKDQVLLLERGEAAAPDVRVAASPDALAAVVYGGQSITHAVKDGTLRVSGDQKVLTRFTKLFPLPSVAPDMRKSS